MSADRIERTLPGEQVLEGILTGPRRLADGPNRAQRRAAMRAKTRNATDGREEAIRRGRAVMRAKAPANDREHEARGRR